MARVVEDLKTKKAWFEANQACMTAEAMAKAEAEIQRLTKGKEGPEHSFTLKVADKPGVDAGSTEKREKKGEQVGRRPGSQRPSNRGRGVARGGTRELQSRREESKDGSILVRDAESKIQAIQQFKANKAARRSRKKKQETLT